MKYSDILRSFWYDVKEHVTIEPSIALLSLASVIGNFLFVNLILQKSCRFNVTNVEPDLDTPCDDERAGQRFLAESNSWRYSLGMYLMIGFTLFATSWSDKMGKRRKPLIFIPLIGQTLMTLVGALYAFYWQWPVLSGLIFETIVHGVTGGRFCIMFASQMYISDITDAKSRTVKMAAIGAVQMMSIPLGNGIAGFMMIRFGFYKSFLICSTMTIIGIGLGMVFIRDTSSVETKKSITWWRALNPTIVLKSFKVAFKERPYNKRTIVLLLLCVDALVMFPKLGESTIVYPYLRYKFGWREEEYSVYSFYKLSLLTMGTLLGVIILSKYLRIHDCIIGIASNVSTMLAVLLYAVASSKWQFYAIPWIEMLRGASITVISSYISKNLEHNEMGYLSSVRCCLSFILTPLCFPAYNMIYRSTMDTFPSAFFIFSALASIPNLFLFGAIYYISRLTHSTRIANEGSIRS